MFLFLKKIFSYAIITLHKNIIPIFYLSCNENGVLGYQTMTTRRVHDLGFWNFPQPPLCRFGRRIRLLIGRKYGVSVTELTLLSSGGIYFSIAALIVREGNKGSLYDFVDFSCFPLYMVGLFFASPLISLGLFPFCFVIVWNLRVPSLV